ncbi:KpsF/GutQ family sugar-phosphate isomerase [Adlercreutzia sp. ZJ304]|uniref:KpsF/GutQ family sugar-phosphate isomerase n=1 Tax=Adlercreutzia sp. ZJ304 TaxID=2709791 RepID=UPI0013ED8BAE|nr:KpsF/GutQ family sugar-phosphate isomerase [Adlercreutzia sp. ZJ304]
MNSQEKLTAGKRVFDIEIDALKKVRDELDDIFVDILDNVLSCRGKVIITGMGKPGHIAKKLAATFSSLGTPSFCLHPAEAMHGDLGMVESKDIVIAISYSGESDEIVKILPNLKMIGSKLIAITGNKNSTLAKNSDIVQVLPSFTEACHLGLAPTSSTTSALVYGDALAVVASEEYGFKDVDFGKYHPAGSLGKKLILRVNDLMATGDNLPLIAPESKLMDAIKEISGKKLGAVCVVDQIGKLMGIITDGDLRRLISQKCDIYSSVVSEIMTLNPKRITSGAMAITALKKIHEQDVNCMPVVNENNEVVGLITWQHIVNTGIVI